MARETFTRGRSALPEQAGPGERTISRLRPTPRGICVAVVALILLAVALGTRDATLLLVLVIVALPLGIAPVVVVARARRAAGIKLHMMATPPLVPVGDHGGLLVQLLHSGGGSLPPLRLDRPADHWSERGSAPSLAARPTRKGSALATDVARQIQWDRIGGASTSSTLTLPTRRRGIFTIGPLRLWAYDPFGLFGLPLAVARPVTVVVHPPALGATALQAVRPGSSKSTQSSDGPATVHTDDPGGEWSGLRPYERGDRLHLLSWQAEARFDTLLVHDFRPDSDHAITIVFDDRAGVHRRHAFEHALSAVFGLASAAEAGDTDYDVSTLSGRRLRGANTPDGLVALLTFLAETQPIRSNGNARTSTPSIATGALLVTTPTAVGTLPPSIDHDSLVVVE